MKSKPWFVYIIENEKGHLYCGITTDIERRFKEHSEGKKGAKFFRSGAPVEILFKKKFKDRSEASKFEARVKSLKREEKLDLISRKMKKLQIVS
jgi:putative endonuclease